MKERNKERTKSERKTQCGARKWFSMQEGIANYVCTVSLFSPKVIVHKAAKKQSRQTDFPAAHKYQWYQHQ